jgi:hypothetical protein
MIVGVLKEVAPETRVSLIADGAAQLIKKNIQVWIEFYLCDPVVVEIVVLRHA